MPAPKTLEQYLAADLGRNVCDHSIRASRGADGVISFYIHPIGIDGDTCDFVVDENLLAPNPAIQRAG